MQSAYQQYQHEASSPQPVIIRNISIHPRLVPSMRHVDVHIEGYHCALGPGRRRADGDREQRERSCLKRGKLVTKKSERKLRTPRRGHQKLFSEQREALFINRRFAPPFCRSLSAVHVSSLRVAPRFRSHDSTTYLLDPGERATRIPVARSPGCFQN